MNILHPKKNDSTKDATGKSTSKLRKTKVIGNYGEQLAKNFLIKKGYDFIAQNYYLRGGELDLIMKKDGILIFVEVKTRIASFFGDGQESVNSNKKRKLIRAILHYLEKNKIKFGHIWQLDLIDIQLQKNINFGTIKHYQNILLK